MLEAGNLRSALAALGRTLADRGEAFQVAIVGGAALLLTEAGVRPTQDVDVVAVATPAGGLLRPGQLPRELVEAGEDVAAMLGLDEDWLNAGAAALLADRLPAGYEERLRTEQFGTLTVSVLGRQDLIRLKLYAAADEGPGSRHVQDLRRIGITRSELEDARSWVATLYPGSAPVPELVDVVAVLDRYAR